LIETTRLIATKIASLPQGLMQWPTYCNPIITAPVDDEKISSQPKLCSKHTLPSCLLLSEHHSHERASKKVNEAQKPEWGAEWFDWRGSSRGSKRATGRVAIHREEKGIAQTTHRQR
jgi:hypothetical protein